MGVLSCPAEASPRSFVAIASWWGKARGVPWDDLPRPAGALPRIPEDTAARAHLLGHKRRARVDGTTSGLPHTNTGQPLAFHETRRSLLQCDINLCSITQHAQVLTVCGG